MYYNSVEQYLNLNFPIALMNIVTENQLFSRQYRYLRKVESELERPSQK